MTNWFRYGLSLEATYVAVPAAIGVIVVLAAAWFARKTGRRSLTVATVIASVAFAGLTVAAHREAFGTFAPRLSSSHVETSGTATLHAHGRTIRYSLELENPFADSHKEYLVLNIDGRTHRIRVPVFTSPASGYAGALQPSDWIVLRPTDDPAVYIADTGSFLLSKTTFRIDIRTGHVVVIHRAR